MHRMDIDNHGEMIKDINDQNKTVRKRALENCLSLASNDVSFLKTEGKEDLIRAILKCFNDKYERCREFSTEIAILFVKKHKEDMKQHLPYIFQIFFRRLSVEEEYEPSEEVRMRLMTLLSTIFETYPSDLNMYVEDTIEVIINTLEDKCPDIKKQAAENLIRIAGTNKKVFYARGENLVAPLARNISHRQASVRSVTVAAVGQLVLATQGGVFENLVNHMAQRVFDPNPGVRLKHVEVIGSWLVAMPDRYSYWYKLVPLLLVSLADNVPEIVAAAEVAWTEAGLQWLEENKMNDKRLKDEMDFLTEDPAHYPDWIERPNLGCRLHLVFQINYNIDNNI